MSIYACAKTLSLFYTFLLSPTEKQIGEQDAQLIILLGKIDDLEKNMEKIIKRMEKLETAVVGLQLSNIPTRDPAPPLPPRNKTKQQVHPVTHEVSLQIPPGFLIPAKLTDL